MPGIPPSRTSRLQLAACVLAAAVTPCPASAQTPSIETVMERAGRYVGEYAALFSSVVAEERSDQSSAGGPRDPVSDRRILSDIIVVRVPGSDEWMGFRDVFEVDGTKVRDREDRLLKLFVESPATAVAQARRLADESARYNVGDLTRNFNLPTTGVFVLLPKAQWRFTFRKAGEQDRNGVRYWVVRGTEWARPTMVQTSMGRDAEMTVEYLIEPDTGRVARSKISLQRPADIAITVEYRPDGKLGFWVPVRMDESYDSGTTRIRCTAAYSNFRRFQVNTDTSFRDR